jgi:hypothetical protein
MSKDNDKPAGLPPVAKKSAPDSLPPIAKSQLSSNLDGNRNCPKCGQEGRSISNQFGLSMFCNACKFHWPISSTPIGGLVVPTPGRGLRKQTLVQPDWDIAFDPNVGGEHGPPRRK